MRKVSVLYYNTDMLLKLAVGIIAIGALATGGYFIAKEEGSRTLTKTFNERLAAGDYLAALGAAGEMKKEAGSISPAMEDAVSRAARLLIADDVYRKAQRAADEERWIDARALLLQSEAVTDPDFKYFTEAQELLKRSEALAAGMAHQTAVTIGALEEKAKVEQGRRQELEQNKKKLEGTLSEREKSLTQSKAETAAARERAEQSQRETEAKQAALLAEQARAKQLMEQVERESKQKFFTELKTYRDMAQKGREQLDNAVIEINAKRDPTALIYVKQGESFFADTKIKASEMRSIRTPSAYQSNVDDLLKSLEQFIEASKQFRTAIYLIEDQSSAEFTSGFSKGKAALANAVTYLSKVSDLIAANP